MQACHAKLTAEATPTVQHPATMETAPPEFAEHSGPGAPAWVFPAGHGALIENQSHP